MQDQPPPLPPQPIDYAHPQTGARIAPILSARIAIHVWAIAGAFFMSTLFAIPKFESVFRDFKVELPLVTKITLDFTRPIINNIFVLVLVGLMVIGVPFGLSALLGIGDPTKQDVRRREVWICRGLRLVALLMIVWMALSMFLPYATLLDAVSSPH
ncbi:hypothetical protein BH10PLA1_BH10PLA1_19700 [soil metagenome]